ncbi:MAG: AMP-binding protein [Dehalococcoidia bacterium]
MLTFGIEVQHRECSGFSGAAKIEAWSGGLRRSTENRINVAGGRSRDYVVVRSEWKDSAKLGRELAYMLNHSGAKALVFDSEFAPVVRSFKDDVPTVTTFVQVVDTHPKAGDIDGPDYESFLNSAPPLDHLEGPDSELDTIAINYTSGTTGFPKRVQYNCRGAYLNALGNALEVGLNVNSSYLWTVPLFHCNGWGWCFPCAVTAVGGTHVCLRRVDPAEIYRLIGDRGVTHLCAAPTVLTMMYSAPEAEGQDLTELNIVTGGAPPAPQVVVDESEILPLFLVYAPFIGVIHCGTKWSLLYWQFSPPFADLSV